MRRMSDSCLTVGEVELEDNVLVIRRIHVVLRLKADESQRKPRAGFTVSTLTNVLYIAHSYQP